MHFDRLRSFKVIDDRPKRCDNSRTLHRNGRLILVLSQLNVCLINRNLRLFYKKKHSCTIITVNKITKSFDKQKWNYFLKMYCSTRNRCLSLQARYLVNELSGTWISADRFQDRSKRRREEWNCHRCKKHVWHCLAWLLYAFCYGNMCGPLL